MDFKILHRNIPLMPPAPRMVSIHKNNMLAYRAKIIIKILRMTFPIEVMDRFQNNLTEIPLMILSHNKKDSTLLSKMATRAQHRKNLRMNTPMEPMDRFQKRFTEMLV